MSKPNINSYFLSAKKLYYWDMVALWNDRVHSDLILKARDKTYQVHKVVLVSRSSRFKAMLGTKKNDVAIMDIVDVQPDVLDELLMYIYTGKFIFKFISVL